MYQHFLHVWFPLMKVRWLQGNEMQRMCAAAFFRCKHSWEFLQRWNTGGYLQHLVKLGSWNPNSSPSFSWKKTDVWWCVAMVHAHLMLNQQCIYDEVLWSRYPSESWASGQKFLYEPGPVAVPESASCGSGVDVQKPWCLLGSNQWVPLVHPGSSGLGDGNPKKSKSCDIDLLAFWPTAIFMCKWLCQGEKSCLFVRRFPVTPAFGITCLQTGPETPEAVTKCKQMCFRRHIHHTSLKAFGHPFSLSFLVGQFNTFQPIPKND